MKSKLAVVEKYDEDDVAALVSTLHRTQQRLQQMAGRGVDAVTLPDGNVYFLVEAQESLRRTQAARDEAAASQAAILNGLPAHIALIDHNGVIVSVNDGWRRFSGSNGLQDAGSGVGENYLGICEQAGQDFGDEASRAAIGIRAVMSGAVREFSIEYPCHSTTEQRWFRLTVSPLQKDAPGGAVVMHVDITERKQAEEKTSRSRALMAMASRVGRLGAWTVDLPSLDLTWSEEVRAIHEVLADYLPTVETGIDFYAPEFRGAIRDAVDHCIWDGTPFDVELQIITAGGTRLWVRVIGEPLRDGAGVSTRIQGAFQDITDRKAAERELTRINRALKTLSNCNEALIRAEHEQDLLDKICRIAVEHGGYGMAWVGFARDDTARRITPEAHAGDDEGYLSEMKDTWHENDPSGMGVAGRVIRSGKAEVCEDITKDAAFSHWLPVALKHGCRSVVVLPLRDASRTFGLLALHSAEEKSTSTDELRLLQELADDLAFGILNLRARIEKARLETAVLKVAASVSATGGTEFFNQLACNMAEALGAQAAFIVRKPPGEPPICRTMAAVIEGRIVDNFDYPIIGTPSENLLTRESCVITKNAAGLFPEARTIAALGAEGYAGLRLSNSAGEQLGLLCVIFRKQIVNIDFVTSTLQIFAARAASEIERQQTDAQLRHQATLLDVAHDAIHLDDLDSRVIFWNKGAERLYGWSAEEALGRASDEMLHRSGADSLRAMKAIVGAGEWKGEAIKRTKDGRDIFVDMHWTLVRDDNGEPKSILAIETDITDRKAGEKELTRVHRALKIKMLSNCNETLIWAESERELLDKICRIVIEHGGYSMAWVGYAIDDDYHTITPMAHAGVENGYFSEIKLSWSADRTAGWGPAGMAIRDGRTTVCDDISLEPGCSVSSYG